MQIVESGVAFGGEVGEADGELEFRKTGGEFADFEGDLASAGTALGVGDAAEGIDLFGDVFFRRRGLCEGCDEKGQQRQSGAQDTAPWLQVP